MHTANASGGGRQGVGPLDHPRLRSSAALACTSLIGEAGFLRPWPPLVLKHFVDGLAGAEIDDPLEEAFADAAVEEFSRLQREETPGI